MANCKTCDVSVSCSCTLIDGNCTSCYLRSKSIEEPTNPEYFSFNPNTSTITEVAQSRGISKEEQLKRINAILLNARDKTI